VASPQQHARVLSGGYFRGDMELVWNQANSASDETTQRGSTDLVLQLESPVAKIKALAWTDVTRLEPLPRRVVEHFIRKERFR
jgi:hypothetical protein